MHARRDQVQAHTFMVGRLVSALLQGDPDRAVTPMRRTPVGLIIGLVLAVLAVGGLAVLAVLVPADATGWRKPGTLVVERETGTRFVLLDGRLRPVLNYASARLLLGPALTIHSVPASSLAGVPRGGAVGIVGGPDTLPAPAQPGAQPWLVCAASTMDAAGASRAALTLRIGDVAHAHPLPDQQAVLVRTADGTRYLAWRDRRMRLSAQWAERALGLDGNAAVPVRDSWIDVLPAGPDLGSQQVPGRGTSGPLLDGRPTTVGQVFVVHGTGLQPRFYQLSGGGLVPLTVTAAALALGDPATAASYGTHPPLARELSPAALGSAAVLPAPEWQAQVPSTPPALAARDGQLPCARVEPGGDRLATSLVTAPAGAVDRFTVEGVALDRNTRVADQITVGPSGGFLAHTRPASEASGAGLYLVTEDGAKYPIGSAAAAEALGTPVSSAIAVPAELLALLPTGPVLDRIGKGGDAPES